MKKLPDEKKMLEMLELIRSAEQVAREICEMSTVIALKYQRRVREIKESRQPAEMTD